MTSHRLRKLQQKWPLLYNIDGALNICAWYASIDIADLMIKLEI